MVIISSWWAYGLVVGLGYLALQREHLVANNLKDTNSKAQYDAMNAKITCNTPLYRTVDGTCNNLENKAMGSRLVRFGRNVPISNTATPSDARVLEPNPRTVARTILHRKNGVAVPAPSINVLASSWIQFQTHDWFSHGMTVDNTNPYKVPLMTDDPLYPAQKTMDIGRTLPDKSRDASDAEKPATYQNENTHWWDLEQIYGRTALEATKLRAMSKGKMYVDPKTGLLPRAANGEEITGFNGNWWLGLSVWHNVWVKEHNSIADMLLAKNPTWDDEKIYQVARQINCALNAKIHTVEWTPALLANTQLQTGMHGNWFGVLPQFIQDMLPPGYSNAVITGIVGGPIDIAGVDFTFTEEFVAVYRMHSLLPETLKIMDFKTGVLKREYTLEQATFNGSGKIQDTENFLDILTGMGASVPGALTVNNYPSLLTKLKLPGTDTFTDMAVIDIIRDRERGIPRYTEFRKLMAMSEITTFEQISTDPTTVTLLKKAYNNKLEDVDLIVGCLAEQPRPENWAFGETAFMVFLVMASRRLYTDRFFTKDFTPAVYTQDGLDWIKANTMNDILGRNFPEIMNHVNSADNAFRPWVINGAKVKDAWYMTENYKAEEVNPTPPFTTGYEGQTASKKLEDIWAKITANPLSGPWPALLDKAKLFIQSMSPSVEYISDELPSGRNKLIRSVGVTAKVKFAWNADAITKLGYTGLFKSAQYGTIRASSVGAPDYSKTTDPASASYVPGFAVKFFRTNAPSANVLFMNTLFSWSTWNWFANPMSTHLSSSNLDTTLTLAQKKFESVSAWPTFVGLSDFAKYREDGTVEAKPEFPFQLVFKPAVNLKSTYANRVVNYFDMFQKEIKSGANLYSIWAVPAPDFDPIVTPDITKKVAVQCSVSGESKYFSIDTKFNMCGECCMKPASYSLYKVFEPNLLAASTANPCADKGYVNYRHTVTHGVYPLSMTLDMYAQPAKLKAQEVYIGDVITTSDFTTSSFSDTKYFHKHTIFEDDLAIHPEWLYGCPNVQSCPVCSVDKPCNPASPVPYCASTPVTKMNVRVSTFSDDGLATAWVEELYDECDRTDCLIDGASKTNACKMQYNYRSTIKAALLSGAKSSTQNFIMTDIRGTVLEIQYMRRAGYFLIHKEGNDPVDVTEEYVYVTLDGRAKTLAQTSVTKSPAGVPCSTSPYTCAGLWLVPSPSGKNIAIATTAAGSSTLTVKVIPSCFSGVTLPTTAVVTKVLPPTFLTPFPRGYKRSVFPVTQDESNINLALRWTSEDALLSTSRTDESLKLVDRKFDQPATVTEVKLTLSTQAITSTARSVSAWKVTNNVGHQELIDGAYKSCQATTSGIVSRAGETIKAVVDGSATSGVEGVIQTTPYSLTIVAPAAASTSPPPPYNCAATTRVSTDIAVATTCDCGAGTDTTLAAGVACPAGSTILRSETCKTSLVFTGTCLTCRKPAAALNVPTTVCKAVAFTSATASKYAYSEEIESATFDTVDESAAGYQVGLDIGFFAGIAVLIAVVAVVAVKIRGRSKGAAPVAKSAEMSHI